MYVRTEHCKQKAQSSSKIVHIQWVAIVHCRDHRTTTLLSIFVVVFCCGGVFATLNATSSRRAARERIDKAEQMGRRRDEQLEMLHAVRQYMAQTKAHARALQAQC